jgi:hypothetical protein
MKSSLNFGSDGSINAVSYVLSKQQTYYNLKNANDNLRRSVHLLYRVNFCFCPTTFRKKCGVMG